MVGILFILVGASVATNSSALPTNIEARAETVITTSSGTLTNDPVEKEFQKVMAEDDAARAQIDRWITDNQAFAARGAGEKNEDLNKRIRARLETVQNGYEEFLARHTNHSRAHLAYAGFLQDSKDDDSSLPHMEKAAELDPKNPAVWNNLANFWGHYGEPKKAFKFYTKALELDPTEPIYYHNFGTTVYLFRNDAKEVYNLNEQQVFNKALELYSNAMRLSPDDFPLATDIAQSYYGIRPFRPEEALKAWTNALAIAHDDIEREGTYVHLSRVNWMAGRTNVALGYLKSVTNEMYTELKRRLTTNMSRPFVEWSLTNRPTVAPTDKSTSQ